MADKASKQPENAAGPFYVDGQCIACDLCSQTAPDNFKKSDASGYTYVSKQPAIPAEKELCERAKDECPSSAIGNDG
jgi:ferredoxin